MRARTVLLVLLAGIASAQQDLPQLVVGKPLTVELNASTPSLRARATAAARERVYVSALATEARPSLRLETRDGAVLGQDDGAEGLRVPCIVRDAAAGDELVIVVTGDAAPVAAGTRVVLSLTIAPESETAIAALASTRTAIESATAARSKPERDAARKALASAWRELIAAAGADASPAVADSARRFASLAFDLGDLETAKRAREHLVRFLEAHLPDDHPDLQRERTELAWTLKSQGDLTAARALFEKASGILDRTQHTEDPLRCLARQELAATMKAQGDLRGARPIEEELLAIRTRSLPDDHPDLAVSRQNLAVTLAQLGELGTARRLFEKVLEVRQRTLPDDHFELQRARGNLAMNLNELGYIHEARELQMKVLEIYMRTLPDEHPELQRARGNLAMTSKWLGDLSGARALEEKVLDVNARVLPENHPDLARARLNLAATIFSLGDLEGARVLDEQALDVLTRTLPDDHPLLQSVRGHMGAISRELGDLQGARALEEKVLAVLVRTLPADHDDIQKVREILSELLADMGDWAAARDLAEKALESRERVMPADHLVLAESRLCMASMETHMGHLVAARGLVEKALEVCQRTLPEGDLDLQWARHELAWLSVRMKDEPRARALARDLAQDVRVAVQGAALSLSPREAEAAALREGQYCSSLLSICPGDADLDGIRFAVIEALRGVGERSARAARLAARSREQPDADLGELRRAVSRRALEVARLAGAEGASERWVEAVREKERAERELRARMGADALLADVDAARIAAGLKPGEVAVGYWRYVRQELDRGESRRVDSEQSLLAFVLRKDSTLVRVELGPADAIDRAVARWREALLATREPSAPLGAEETSRRVREAGEALRRLVLDPLKPALGDARSLVVALDEPLFAVPLDALPMDEGGEGGKGSQGGAGYVGDAFAIHIRTSLSELDPRASAPVGSDAPAEPNADRLVLLGGVDYSRQPGERTASQPVEASGPVGHPADGAERTQAGTAPGASERGRTSTSFAPLPGTRAEVRAIADVRRAATGAREASDARLTLLEGAAASRSALESSSAHARWLHIATHGYYARDSAHSTDDERANAATRSSVAQDRAGERVRGLSPLVLCGLALAGANAAPDALGRVPGLVTAEELAGLDLSRCELATLSACDTNVGVRRAGQGIASLQRALRMAGARSVITSSWAVSDDATRELMTAFYRGIWLDKLTKSEALWRAKVALRKRRAPACDWAGWVLCGDP